MSETIVNIFNWNESPFAFRIKPELFVGYTNEVNTILTGLGNGDKFSLLVGPTGSGKTTLIKTIEEKMRVNGDKLIYFHQFRLYKGEGTLP